MNTILEDIIKSIEASSSFTCDDKKEQRYLLFSTREHGMRVEEEASYLDVQEAQRVVKLIKSKYPDLGVEYKIETVDEWVMIFITAPHKLIPIYHFMKHLSRHWRRFAQGFSKGFYSMEELIEHYGFWDEVKDVDLIKMKDVDVPDKTVKPYGEFNMITQIYDAGDENKYSYSIGYSFKEEEVKLVDFIEEKFGSHK